MVKGRTPFLNTFDGAAFFPIRGTALTVSSGAAAKRKLKRTSIAKTVHTRYKFTHKNNPLLNKRFGKIWNPAYRFPHPSYCTGSQGAGAALWYCNHCAPWLSAGTQGSHRPWCSPLRHPASSIKWIMHRFRRPASVFWSNTASSLSTSFW